MFWDGGDSGCSRCKNIISLNNRLKHCVKNVYPQCYGGDVSRKKETLTENKKDAKTRMKQGEVEVTV